MLKIFLTSALAAIFCLPVSARQILLIRPDRPNKIVCEGAADYLPKGGRYVLDLSQGYVLAITPAFVSIPICRSENGGNQTLFKVSSGKVRSNFRTLSHPASSLKIASSNWRADLPPGLESAVAITGTEFTVEAVEGGIQVGMNEGRARVISGGVEATIVVGQAATLKEGKPPEIYQINYSLNVTNKRLGREFQANVITGCIEKGNTIAVDEGTVEMTGPCVDKKGEDILSPEKKPLFSFKATTPLQFLKVANPGGTERYLFFGGRRPFNE